jgi:hypothetical protein
LSPEAKRSLFSRYGTDFVNNLNTIANTAGDIIEAGKVYANPSGTAPALTLNATVGGAILALLTGHIHIAAGIAAEEGFSLGSAKLMTSPKFVDWLARNMKRPTAALPAALNSLSQQAQRNGNMDVYNFATNAAKSIQATAAYK